MAAPLLISSLAIIFAFAPLVMGASESAEYMRSLAIVLGATLLISLFLALTVTVVTAKMFAGHADHEKEEKGVIARIRRWYAERVRAILKRPVIISGAMTALLAAALALSSLLPSELFSASNRKQVQITVELPAGASSRESYALAEAISTRLADQKAHATVTGNIAYVGDGGPRFILGLNPPMPAANRAYIIANLDHVADIDGSIAQMRTDLTAQFPQARIEAKRFSLGVSEAGAAVFRLVGDDRGALLAASAKLQTALQAIPGMTDVKDDAEGRINRLVVEVDQARALAAGVTSASVAQALETAYAGGVATVLRQGDVLVPVVLRAAEADRFSPERLLGIPVFGRLGPVALAEVATVRLGDQPSVLIRRNEQPAITVTARHPDLTAQGVVDAAAPALGKLALPAGHTILLGGEIEEAADANSGLVTYFPLALLGMAALFLWQFGSVRKTAIVMASIPFVLIGATLGLLLTGQPFSYSATLGLLALAGIIVNNAVLLLERIAEEKALGKSHEDAVADAAAVRLRPIVMTKLTCVTGLVPLFIFGGDLWRPLAAAMIGGLALGTLITLVLIPALYTLLFARLGQPHAKTNPAVETTR
jgi:multidrug efflux pump subunit AcrB